MLNYCLGIPAAPRKFSRPRGRAGGLATSLLMVAISFGWLGLQPLAWGGNGGVNVLPLPGRLNTSGVRVVVDSRWIDANGYHPVRIEIHPLKSPAPADRTFRVVVRPNSYYGNIRDSASQIIELEQGATKATGTVLVPQDAPWHAITVDVHEDGREHPDLSGDQLSWPRTNYWNWHEGTAGVLLIDSKAPTLNERERLLQLFLAKGLKGVETEFQAKLPDLRNLMRRFPNPNSPTTGSEITLEESRAAHAMLILMELKDNPKVEVMPFQELPTRWLELNSFDLIFISTGDLRDLGKQQPKALKALGEWNRAGGVLTVYDAGKDFAELAEIEKLLGMPRQTDRQLPKQREWRSPDAKAVDQAIRGMVDDPRQWRNQGFAGPPGMMAGGSPPNLNVQPPPSTAANAPRPEPWKFVLGDNGLGQVVAFDGNPFPGDMDDWAWFLNSIRGEAWNPALRAGATQHERNEEFWNFLIPGTGQAPVLSFLVFITLFVALIGPANYYLLQRSGRLYLLLVTVPLGAMLVTGGLFLYAVLTDGLGVKSRVRSYTMLDQRAGTVVSTSRQAYYASVAPSKGFDFQDDTAITPYLHKPVDRHGRRMIRHDVNWVDHEQNLKSGYILSRTLSQLLVNRSNSTKARLKVDAPRDKTLKVTNDLGMPLQYLLVRAEDDQYYEGENIQPGEATLKQVNEQMASQEFSKRMRAREPEYPAGYDASMHDTPLEAWSFGGRYYGNYGNNSNVNQAASLLERRLARFTRLIGNPLQKRSFAAISEHAPEVPIGVSAARQYESLHVIEGQY